MTSSPHDPNGLPFHGHNASIGEHRSVTTTIGQWVISMALVVFWGLSAIAVLPLAYIALRGIWWAVKLATTALGI